MKDHQADSSAENRGIFANVAKIIREHNKKDSNTVEVIPVWLVIRNTDLTEGRGQYYVKDVCTHKETAHRLAKGAGVQGTDATIKKSYIFKDQVYDYGPFVLGPLTGYCFPDDHLKDTNVQTYCGVVPPTKEDIETERRKEEKKYLKEVINRLAENSEEADEDFVDKIKEFIDNHE